MIPIATTFGQNITLLVGGSFLIESIFDIDGFGLLGLTSILDRDYPVVMGVVLLSSLLLLIGNVLSDLLVASLTLGLGSNNATVVNAPDSKKADPL